MSSNTVNVKINVTDSGGTSKLTDAALKLKGSWDGVEASVSRASKAITSSSIPSKATASAPKSATAAVTPEEYGRTRGAVGTGAAGRDFAKQSQGMGGVVALYATFAANIFAVGAAFEALNKAAAVERLTKATDMMSVQVGANLKGISKDLVEASGHALSFAEAMQFSNVGTSAGLAGSQIANLTKIARGAASALGRDANDSIRRIIQGTAKQEQEILDELGIFVKSKQAFDTYAKEIGVKADDLTGRQRTQAYANEVERLGEKWKKFAEIKDPFSEFLATGKNALNELLGAVSNFISPVMQFLADSKSGIQALLVLVSATLAKRVIPELGGMFNNLFNYDKDKATAANATMLKQVDATISATKAAIIKGQAEIKALGSLTPITAESTKAAFAPVGLVRGKAAGVSAQTMSTRLSKLTDNYTDLSKLKSAEDIEHQITQSLKAQAGFKKDAVAHISALATAGTLEANSTKENLILTTKTKDIASTLFLEAQKRIGAQSTLNTLQKEELSNTISLEKLNAEADRLRNSGNKSRAKFDLPIMTTVSALRGVPETAATEALTIAKEKAAIAQKSFNDAVAAGLPVESKDIAAMNAQTLAANNLATAKANITKEEIISVATTNKSGLKDLMTNSLAGISTSFNQGGWTGFKNGILDSWAAMGNMTKATLEANKAIPSVSKSMGVAANTTSIFAKATTTASGATKVLGLGLKGILGGLSAAFGPIMIAITLWQLFGDTIKEWIGVNDEASKALEAREEKMKEFAETTGLAALSLERLSDIRAEGFESSADVASADEAYATILKSQLDAYAKLQEDKLKIDHEYNLKKRIQEAEDRGVVFDAQSLLLENLANSMKERGRIIDAAQIEELSKERSLIQIKVSLYKGLNSYLEKDYSEKLKLIDNEIQARIQGESKVAEQASTNSKKIQSLTEGVGKSFDSLLEKKKKQRDADTGLSAEAKTLSADLSGLVSQITKVGTESSQVTSLQDELQKIVAGGGVAAVQAALMFEILGEALEKGKVREGGKVLITDMDIVKKSIEERLPQIEGIIKLLSKGIDIPKGGGGKPKEYTDDAKKGFRDIERRIESAKLEQIKLDKEFANTSAIQKRNDAVLGYQSAESNALEKSNALRKNEADLVTTITSSYLALRKTLDSKTKSPEEKLGAVASYAKDANTAVATKDAANQSAELTYQANTTATALSALSKSYELLNIQQANSAAQRDGIFELNELDISYRNELAGLSDAEIARETYAATIRRAAYDQLKSTTTAEEEYNRAVDKAMTTDGDYASVSKELLRLGDLKEEGLVALAIKYKITTDAAQKLLDFENQKLANKGDWTKGAVKGLQDYEKSAMDVAGNTQQAFGKAFKGMEDALTDFVMTGKLDFASLANSIIADMVRMAIQQSITGPLARMAMSFFAAADGAAFNAGGVKAMAKGGAYELGAQAFAKGGSFTNSIVSNPTLFKFANGTGLMGEAGPEAIMPLKRDSNGTLGVRASNNQTSNNVTINIIESPEKAGTQERTTNNGTDMITIFVEKVKSAIASDITRGSGVVPNALSRTYGLNRSAGAY